MLILSGFDVRFSFDTTKIRPSNLTTNVVTADLNNMYDYFQFESEFTSCLEIFRIEEDQDTNVIRAIVSFFDTTVENTSHIDEIDGIGKFVKTEGGVLLGKMSFQMTVDVFDKDWFHLVAGYGSETGIDINTDGVRYYNHLEAFRFTDATASKDANLKALVLSSGEIDEDNPDNSTYQEHALTPTFEAQTFKYEVILLQPLEKMDITATQNDEKASMKLKLPKRDSGGNLVYDTDGETLLYEEKDLQNGIATEFTLNELGKPSTVITVIVTAEDGTTDEEYEITIKRPYGIIKGSIYTEPTKNTTMKNEADVQIYRSTQTQEVINWETAIQNTENMLLDTVHEELEKLIPSGGIHPTNDDGTYEIKVIPGTYDILINKPGYLDQIYINVTIAENETKDFGNVTLIPGDINKDRTSRNFR